MEKDTSDILDTLDWSDYWTILAENRSAGADIVSPSGRPSVLVFGSLLAVWSLCLHVVILWILSRPSATGAAGVRQGTHSRLHWLVCSLSAGQIGLIVLVLPVELLTETRGGWTLGPTLCQWWRPVHIGLISLSLWGHFAVTVERYVRCLRAPDDAAYGQKTLQNRWITSGAVLAVWVVAFTCTIIVTIVMQRQNALIDDICAVDMSPKTAFVLSFVVYFVPTTLVLTAVGALIVISCRRKDPEVHLDHQSCTLTRNAKVNEAFGGSTTTMGRCTITPERNYGAHALLLATVPDPELQSLYGSIKVVLAANFVCFGCWAPFYVTSLVVPFCDGMCVDPTLWTLLLWLGYASVGLGPIVWYFEPSIRSKAKAAIG